MTIKEHVRITSGTRDEVLRRSAWEAGKPVIRGLFQLLTRLLTKRGKPFGGWLARENL